MSDKSSDTEDWTFVDKDGEVELSDEGSSASSIEVVIVESDVVTYQNRRSLERSVSPTFQSTSAVDTENEKLSEEGLVAVSSLSSTSLENQETIETKGSLASNNNEDNGDHRDIEGSEQELSPIISFTDDQPKRQREMSVTSDTSCVPSIPSDVSDHSSEADSDYIRLESESLDGDNRVMTSSSVSSNFNFISRENSPLTDDGSGDNIDVASGSKEELEESSNSASDKSINQEHYESFNKEPDKGMHLMSNLKNNQEFNDDPVEYNNHLNDEFHNLEDGNQLLQANVLNLADINGRLENGIQNFAVDNQVLEADNQNAVEVDDGLDADIQHHLVDNQVLEADNQNAVEVDDGLDADIQHHLVDNQILEADNQNAVEVDDGLDVDIQHELVDNHVLEDDNHNQRDNDNLENEDLSDLEHHDQSAEVEEDQDRNTDSGTEDDRIESDQSDTGSIPPLDDDMSFVNDIGDLPLIAGDVARQYVHNPNRHLNLILDVIAILMFAVVLGLGIGHAIATFDEIEEYETLHSNIANLRSQALTCQNQKWSQKLTINDLRVDHQSLNMKYEESKAEQEKLRIKNALLLMELEAFRKLETRSNGDNDIRINLQNEINQLKIEKEDLKQMIGQLKYTTHPAIKNVDNTDNSQSNIELCDKTASDTTAALKYHGKRLSDCSIDDLQEIHNSEIIDNSLLKQEVGRLRYTSKIGNQVTNDMEFSGDKMNEVTEQQKITEDVKCENMTALKDELDHAKRYADIWYQKYNDLKEQNQLNTSNCLKYIISNFNATQFYSSVNTTALKTWLVSSAIAAKDFQNVVSEMSSKVWEDVSNTSQEIFHIITDEFQTDDDLDYDTDVDVSDHVDDATDHVEDAKNHDGVKDFADDVTDFVDGVTDFADDYTDLTDDDNTDQDVDSKGLDNEEIDSDSSNDTNENTNHQAKWSDKVKDILNKTRHEMSNVSQQIKATWLQVKNLSHEFLTQHEGKVTKTLTKFTNKFVNIGKRLKNKLQRKVSKWYRKDKGEHKNDHTPEQHKNKESSEGKIRREKGHTYQKNEQHDSKGMKRCRKNAKHLKQQKNQDRKRVQLQEKKKERSEKKFEKTIFKYQYKISNKMNEEVFEQLDKNARQSELNKIFHMKRFAAELDLFSYEHQPDGKIKNYLEFLNCQDLWWSSVVIKDMLSGSQILYCSQFLPDWQMTKLLKRRRTMFIKGKLQMSDELIEQKVSEIQRKFGILDGNEEINHVEEETRSDDAYIRYRGATGDSSHWQFQRAQDREEVRQRKSDPDWFFQRANRRRESREEESEPDWLFERAKHRKDLRYKEWEEPEWTFERAKHREEVREVEHQPDWIFDRAHDRKELREKSSRSSRPQRHISCEDF